jgi:hypothetical protein
MKKNIKKLAVFAMIAAIAMFTAVAMASADDHEWKAIHGEYAMAGAGTCLVSTSAFLDDFYTSYTVPGPPPFPASSYSQGLMVAGIFTFKRDGRGSVETKQLIQTFPPWPYPWAGSVNINFDFTYTVKDDGTITAAMMPGTFLATYVTGPPSLVPTPPAPAVTYTVDKLNFSGMVSADHKTILLGSGNEMMTVKLSNGETVYSICNTARVLTRLGE